MCVACAQSEDLPDLDVPPETGGECERCGGRTEWVLDRSNGHSWLQCPGHCARVEPPTSAANGAPAVTREFAPSEAAPVSAARGSEILAAAVSHQAAGAAGEAAEGAPWLARGPPPGPVRAATNSWLYVPLLHAAAGDLAPAAVASWQAEQRCSGWWEEARRLLLVAAPIARNKLATALRQSAGASPIDLRQLPGTATPAGTGAAA